MIKVEEIQQHGKEQFDAAVATAGSLQKGVQAIAMAFGDYTRKSFEDGNAFTEKLAGVKSLDKAIEVQTEYAKTVYETFVAESQKIGELYADLAKQAVQAVRGFRGEVRSGRSLISQEYPQMKKPGREAGLFCLDRVVRYFAMRSCEICVRIFLNALAV